MRRRLAVVLATLAVILIAGFAIPLERLGVSAARERLTIGLIRDAYRMADQAAGSGGDWQTAITSIAPKYATATDARVTAVASVITRPARPVAKAPRWINCQLLARPSTELY